VRCLSIKAGMDLRELLDRLYELLTRRYLSTSMLEPVRKWCEAGHPVSDVEVLALTAALYDFQMRVATIKKNFSLLLEYLSSKGLAFRDLSSPDVSGEAVEFTRKRNVGFFHRFDKYGLALPIIVGAACELGLRGAAQRAAGEARKRLGGGRDAFLGLAVAREVLAGLWGTETVRKALRRGDPASKALNLILPRPSSRSSLKRLNLFLRWVVRGEYPDLGLWGFISQRELVVPLDSSIARVCGRLVVGKPLRPSKLSSLRIIMRFLREVNEEDPVKYDFILSRPAILGWCKKDLLQSDCDVCPLRPYCRATNTRVSAAARASGVRGEGPEHREGKLLTLTAVRAGFVVKEVSTGAGLKCWRERTINHGLRPDIYCENDAVIVGEVKVLKKTPKTPSEIEGITQAIRYYKHVTHELRGNRPAIAVLAYYTPKKHLQVPEEVCGTLKEALALTLTHEAPKQGSTAAKGGVIVLEIRPGGHVRNVCHEPIQA